MEEVATGAAFTFLVAPRADSVETLEGVVKAEAEASRVAATMNFMVDSVC